MLVCVASLASVYELIKTFGVKNKLILALGVVFAALTVSYHAYLPYLGFDVPVILILAVYIMLLLIIMIFDFGKTTFNHAALTAFVSVVLPSSLACFLRLKNLSAVDGLVSHQQVHYLVWLTLSSSVLTDTFALFTGMKFGKHKMSPHISPKKTIEGAIGGVIGSTLFNLLTLFICNKAMSEPLPFGYRAIGVFSVIAAVLGILGDLAASAIKRNYDVKDFGHIMPGHGGIMDRMDSISFVAPAVYGCTFVVLKYLS